MDHIRWLSEDEQHTWRSFLAAGRLLFDRLDRQLQHDAGLPHAYYEILVNLSEAPGRTLRMSELAATSLSSRSRLSHAVARLEEAGWVARSACPTDRRGAFAHLTDAGLARLQEAAPGHVEAVRTHLFDRLTVEQQRALREISEAVLAGLGGPLPVTEAGCTEADAACAEVEAACPEAAADACSAEPDPASTRLGSMPHTGSTTS